jgi:hypothetical protein
MLLSTGGMMRSGEAVGFGVPPYPTHWINDPEEIARVIRAADRELAMEATRRAIALQAPSRLSCLYCAQDTPASRNWVESMLGAESFLMRVRVLAAMSAKVCDARWLDEWAREDARRAYWRGYLTADPRVEILIDGVIEAVDADELERLRSYIDSTVVPRDMLNRPPTGR